jgi:N-acetylglucosaminyl-diphospho-decaprenol L-rhamnosyltransferase
LSDQINMPPKRLAVVVLNYKTPALVADCLATLENELDHELDICIVVDNCSGDGSDDQIERIIEEKKWNGWARLVRSKTNDGFSSGNNVGMNSVDAEYYLLLNSDTLVQEGAMSELLRAAHDEPTAGLIGPRLQWPDGDAQNSCFRDKSIWSELIAGAQSGPVTKMFGSRDVTMGVFDEPTRADWVSFACVFVRKSVVDKIGPMDEGYFMYFEDADYCRKARKAGFKVVYWPKARVVHLRGGSAPVKSAAAARKQLPAYYYASRSRYYASFGGRLGLAAANSAWTLGWFIALLRRVFQGRRIGSPKRALRDNWNSFLSPMRTWRPGGAP